MTRFSSMGLQDCTPSTDARPQGVRTSQERLQTGRRKSERNARGSICRAPDRLQLALLRRAGLALLLRGGGPRWDDAVHARVGDGLAEMLVTVSNNVKHDLADGGEFLKVPGR